MTKFLAVDPGLNNTGIAIIDSTSGFKVVETFNVKNSRKFTDAEKIIEAKYGQRAVKIAAIIAKLNEVIETYSPTWIISEAPFYNALTPAAYGSLVEVVSNIKYGVAIPNNLDFATMEPLLVKKFFTNKGMAPKDIMKQFLVNRTLDGSVEFTRDISTLTEHEIDAIAVGFAFYVHQQLKNQGEQS